MLSQKSSLCRAGSFLSADYIRDVSCKCAKATHKNAQKRTRAFVSILSCDTWLLRLFLPATVARHLLAFAEFYMPVEVSHAGVRPHLRE